MTNFNYQKAYFVQAKPSFINLNKNQKETFNKLHSLVENLQHENLNIPLSKEMGYIINMLSTKEIATLSNISYFIGHWKPSNAIELFNNEQGQSWKISNVLDQVLRSKLDCPHNILIHEGKFRITFSSKRCWLWDEFSLATEKNLETFKNCNLSFNEEDLNKSAKELKDIINDLWNNVETEKNNKEYLEFLVQKKQFKLEKLKKDHLKRIKEAKDSIKTSKQELNGFVWLLENNIYTDCIFYNHTKSFCFGWLYNLTEIEKEKLQIELSGFPFDYEFK